MPLFVVPCVLSVSYYMFVPTTSAASTPFPWREKAERGTARKAKPPHCCRHNGGGVASLLCPYSQALGHKQKQNRLESAGGLLLFHDTRTTYDNMEK